MRWLFAVLLVVIVAIWMGVSGFSVGDWVGDFFQGLKPEGRH